MARAPVRSKEDGGRGPFPSMRARGSPARPLPRSCAFVDHAGPRCLAQAEPLLSQQLAAHPFLSVFFLKTVGSKGGLLPLWLPLHLPFAELVRGCFQHLRLSGSRDSEGRVLRRLFSQQTVGESTFCCEIFA